MSSGREDKTMKRLFFIFFLAAMGMSFAAGCAQRPISHPMRGWGHMMGYGGYGGVIMWIVLLALAAVIVYFVFRQINQNDNRSGTEKENPLDIAKRRYAAGEISKEEFERLKNDIEN
jgi:putative membrane protein